jgi:hypothetical protein
VSRDRLITTVLLGIMLTMMILIALKVLGADI